MQFKRLVCFTVVALAGFVCWWSVFQNEVWNNRLGKTKQVGENAMRETGAYSTVVGTTKLLKHGHGDDSVAFVFAKTHKTGSTTLKGVLTNFLKRNNVTNIAAMAPYPFIGGYPGRFKCEFLIPRTKRVDVVHGHTRFNADEMKKCVNKNAKYFTIIRQPWDAFQSAYHYYRPTIKKGKWPSCFGMPIAHVLHGRDSDVKDFMMECTRKLNNTVPWYFRFKNFVAHDLGFDPMLRNKKEIQRYIEELDRHMDLVMITEYMEESMVLLKDLLGMKWSDFATQDVNRKPYEKVKLEPSIYEKKFRSFYNIDFALYRYFNATFWKKVDAYGRQKMQEDLKSLRKARSFSSRVSSRKPRGVAVSTENFKSDNGEILTEKWKSAMALYMSQNSGSCYLP